MYWIAKLRNNMPKNYEGHPFGAESEELEKQLDKEEKKSYALEEDQSVVKFETSKKEKERLKKEQDEIDENREYTKIFHEQGYEAAEEFAKKNKKTGERKEKAA